MQHLTGFDGMFYAYDHSAVAPSIMGSLLVFAPTPTNDAADVEKVVARLEERLAVIPPLRRIVVGVPTGLNNQYWREVAVDVREHVREVTVAAPGGDREVAAAVAAIMERRLGRDKPMWDYTIMHGLSDGRVAHLVRIHHAATDGGTMQRVIGLLGDEYTTFRPTPSDERPPARSGREEWLEMAGRGIRRTAFLPGQLLSMSKNTGGWARARYADEGLSAVPALIARVLPGGVGQAACRFVGRNRKPGDTPVTPIMPSLPLPSTPFNAKLSNQRRYAYCALSLKDLLRVGKYYGVTLNTVLTAVSAGAARQYMIGVGAPVDEPLVLMSVYSLRQGHEDNYWANYASSFFGEIPIHIADPVERLRVAHINNTTARANFDTMPTGILVDMSRMIPQTFWDLTVRITDRLPAAVVKRTSIAGNFMISNIRGPAEHFRMFGHEATGFYPVSFLFEGLAHNLTASSYGDELQLGIVGCPTAFEDVWDWPELLGDGLDELVRIVDAETGTAAAAPAPVTGAPGRPAGRRAKPTATATATRSATGRATTRRARARTAAPALRAVPDPPRRGSNRRSPGASAG
ncbi:MAG: wax ester/triacylglycerol synthase domain-containing protein [Dermatophilaceae bacterium]